MPSPFPGMDPWLEDPEVFGDVHDVLITCLREALNHCLPPGYAAGTGTRVWTDDVQRREPDVSLVRRDRPGVVPAGGLVTLPGLTAVGFSTDIDPWDQPFLEVRTGKGKRLVTCIEIVSRSNKSAGSKGRELYCSKQEECRAGGVNLVEIDLLRGGPHVTSVPKGLLERRAGAFDYHVSVVRAGARPEWFGAAVKLADRLPAIGIPLDADVPAVTVDLQAAFDRCYDGGRYPDLVDYAGPPDPPLTPDQQTWADAILRAKGLKP